MLGADGRVQVSWRPDLPDSPLLPSKHGPCGESQRSRGHVSDSWCSPERRVDVLSLVLVSVTLFGNKVLQMESS